MRSASVSQENVKNAQRRAPVRTGRSTPRGRGRGRATRDTPRTDTTVLVNVSSLALPPSLSKFVRACVCKTIRPTIRGKGTSDPCNYFQVRRARNALRRWLHDRRRIFVKRDTRKGRRHAEPWGNHARLRFFSLLGPFLLLYPLVLCQPEFANLNLLFPLSLHRLALNSASAFLNLHLLSRFRGSL